MSRKEVRVWQNRLSWREPSPIWNVQCERSASRSISLPSMFPRKRTVPMLSLQSRISGACTRVLISVSLPVKGFDDELEEVEHIEESIGLQAERLFTGRSES